MAATKHIQIPKKELAKFCRRYHIRRLSLFGSVLTDRFKPESDIDVLVEFDPDHIPGLLLVAQMERELAPLFSGHKVDLRTPEDLSLYFRQEVIQNADVQYAQG